MAILGLALFNVFRKSVSLPTLLHHFHVLDYFFWSSFRKYRSHPS